MNINLRSAHLEEIIKEKFLNKRLFPKLSENMHYELLKYVNSFGLLEIRLCNLGGFQITSNTVLRSRIKNYFPKIIPKKAGINLTKIRFFLAMFEQTGENSLSFDNLKLGNNGALKLGKFLHYMPSITKLNLSKLYTYIYIYI